MGRRIWSKTQVSWELCLPKITGDKTYETDKYLCIRWGHYLTKRLNYDLFLRIVDQTLTVKWDKGKHWYVKIYWKSSVLIYNENDTWGQRRNWMRFILFVEVQLYALNLYKKGQSLGYHWENLITPSVLLCGRPSSACSKEWKHIKSQSVS